MLFRSDALIAHLDLPATFAAITGAPVPAGQCRDSFNILPALLGERTAAPVRPHFVAHNGGTEGPFALIAGDWKYLQVAQPIRAPDTRGGEGAKAKAKAKGAGGAPMLINLAKDIGENEDLSAREPAKLAEMRALLEKIRAGGQ